MFRQDLGEQAVTPSCASVRCRSINNVASVKALASSTLPWRREGVLAFIFSMWMFLDKRSCVPFGAKSLQLVARFLKNHVKNFHQLHLSRR